MNAYSWLVLAVLVGHWLLRLVVETLNLRRQSPGIPSEFEGFYAAEKYAAAQRYQREGARFGLWQDGVTTAATVAFLAAGGLGWVDGLARAADGGLILTGLLFLGLLFLLGQLLSLPFQAAETFGLEQRHGFNLTTPATFLGDQLKGLLLAALLGGPLAAGVLWFFARSESAWLWSWAAVVGVQVLALYLAPALILPLFNRFTPLPEGPLREAIERYARSQNFQMQGVFTVDGSRRSRKANAFFTGFGRHRRIALYDTLLEKHETPELVAVLAHEIGHYRCRHIHRMLVAGVLSTGLLFWLLGFFIRHPGLYAGFGLDVTRTVGGEAPIYLGLVLFGFLYSPVSLAIGIGLNALSRRHEFEADAFAARTTGAAGDLILALKKLSVDNLSNLTPHPLKVFLEYSHPPVLERIRALRALAR
jgi:STE24 endopeptidase